MKYITALASAVAVAHSAHAAFFADQVVSYSPGAYVGATNNPASVLGSPGAIVDFNGPYAGVFSPFNSHYEPNEIVSVGAGGEITLQLSKYVTIDRTPGVLELGVWENVFLRDDDYPNGNAGATADASASADSAVVKVSEDGVNWFTLNSGNPILFTLPGNYFNNASTPFQVAAPANPQYADFGKPFTGTLTDFNGKNFSQILTLLNGSAGGTWLNLDEAPFSKVGFVRFDGVATGKDLELNAIAINSSLAGGNVPEPGTFVAVLAGLGVLGIFKRRRL